MSGARIGLAVALLLLVQPAAAQVPPECGPLFIKAGESNALMLRRSEETRAMIDGELEYVKRRENRFSRISLGKLADEFGQRFGEAVALLNSVEKALRCAAPAMPECRPLYAQVSADKLRVERRMQATSDYLLAFPFSYMDTLAARKEIVRFAEHFTLALQAQMGHQQSTLAAVQCVGKQH